MGCEEALLASGVCAQTECLGAVEREDVLPCLQRRFNTLSLLDHYLGPGQLRAQDIDWNPNDPNVLQMALPGMHSVLALSYSADSKHTHTMLLLSAHRQTSWLHPSTLMRQAA